MRFFPRRYCFIDIDGDWYFRNIDIIDTKTRNVMTATPTPKPAHILRDTILQHLNKTLVMNRTQGMAFGQP